MFFTSEKNTRAGRAIAAGLDIAIDFATLGEYRVVTDTAPAADSHTPASPQAVQDGELWANGIEWSASPARTRAACSLPRARNRAWARSRISG